DVLAWMVKYTNRHGAPPPRCGLCENPCPDSGAAGAPCDYCAWECGGVDLSGGLPRAGSDGGKGSGVIMGGGLASCGCQHWAADAVFDYDITAEDLIAVQSPSVDGCAER